MPRRARDLRANGRQGKSRICVHRLLKGFLRHVRYTSGATRMYKDNLMDFLTAGL